MAPDPTTSPAEISTASVGDLSTLTASLADAFVDDPWFRWLIPRDAVRRTRLRRFFTLELRALAFAAGQVWTDPGRSGASLQLPGDAWRMPTRVILLQGPRFLATFGSRTGHALVVSTRMESRHLREPHLYIAYVGVASAAQGRGLGSALLRPTLDRADRERIPVYLEASSPRSAVLYERLGFVHLDEIRVGSSPPMWRMRRPPGGG